VRGHLDSVGVKGVRGWAVGQAGRPADLTVHLNGRKVTAVHTIVRRPDLLAFTGSEDGGFELDIGVLIRPGDEVAVTDASGAHLAGSPHCVIHIEDTKQRKALALVERDMKILEIGPAFDPMAPRSQGWLSYSLDHATQEELRQKYRGQAVENIEPVDFVWQGGPIEDAIPVEQHGTFDAIVISHVIEHFPDPIGFYQSAAKLLKDNGLICLVVPDKRLTFDYFKPVSLTSDFLLARGRGRHSRKVVFDNLAYNAVQGDTISWNWRPIEDFRFPSDPDALGTAKRLFDAAADDEGAPYQDHHHTIYTPSSFALVILELGHLGEIPFTLAHSYGVSGCEFYATLRKGAPAPLGPAALSAARQTLMKQMIREQGEQAGWLLDD
jgi:SAM-dependent methyltransferase